MAGGRELVAFFTVYMITGNMLADVEYESMASLADPFGIAALQSATKYWTVIERNTIVPELAGNLLWNRLIWMAVGLSILALACVRFNYTRATSGRRWRKKRRARELAEAAAEAPSPTTHAALPRTAPTFSAATSWSPSTRLTRS